MKYIIISDTHSMLDQVKIPKKGDVLIHCGDALGRGNISELATFAHQMSKFNYTHKIYVPGNHDQYTERNPGLSKEMLKYYGIKLIIDEPFEIEGMKCYGSPVTPQWGNWSFMIPRGEEIKKHWAKIPDDTELLITHGPPKGILDYVPRDNFNAGCFDLLQRTADLKNLKYHMFGHIHFCGGQRLIHANTIFINAAICTEEYLPNNQVTKIEI